MKRSDYSPERVVFRTDHSGGSVTSDHEFLASASEGGTAAIAAAV